MNQPNLSNLPGAEAMSETLEFIRNLWGGGMKIPGMTMPTMSIEEIDKQIADLKAVESWLNVNMNMLRGTIQALEVQSGTLSALKSMSESMTAMVAPTAAGGTPAAPQFDFSSFLSAKSPQAATPPGSGSGENKPTAQEAAASDATASAEPSIPRSEASPDAQSVASFNAPLPTAPFADPSAWWNLLQDQFKQAVDTAMAPATSTSTKSAIGPQNKAKPRASAKTVSRPATNVANEVVNKANEVANKPATKVTDKLATKLSTKPPAKPASKSVKRRAAPRS